MTPHIPRGAPPSVSLNAATTDRLRHDLKTSLAVILGHTHLARRRMARLDRLSHEDQEWLMARLALIETAVAAAVASVERIDHLTCGAASDGRSAGTPD